MSNVKELFDQLKTGLDDPEVKKTALKKGNAVFSFDFKDAGKYYIDLKDKGTAGEGASPGTCHSPETRRYLSTLPLTMI